MIKRLGDVKKECSKGFYLICCAMTWMLAYLIGFICFDLLRIRRQEMLQHLSWALGGLPKHHVRIARASWSRLVLTLLEFILAPYFLKHAKIQWVDHKHADEALRRGLGAYFLCIHMSNWEWMASYRIADGKPIHAYAKHLGPDWMNRWIQNRRQRIGFIPIHMHTHESQATKSLKYMFRVLKNGGIIGVMVDQRYYPGRLVPLFGRDAYTNPILLKFYQKHSAPIVPIAMRRVGLGRYQIRCYPEFLVHETCQDDASWHAVLQRMNHQVEQMILDNPKEYLWMHKRWKT